MYYLVVIHDRKLDKVYFEFFDGELEVVHAWIQENFRNVVMSEFVPEPHLLCLFTGSGPYNIWIFQVDSYVEDIDSGKVRNYVLKADGYWFSAEVIVLKLYENNNFIGYVPCPFDGYFSVVETKDRRRIGYFFTPYRFDSTEYSWSLWDGIKTRGLFIPIINGGES